MIVVKIEGGSLASAWSECLARLIIAKGAEPVAEQAGYAQILQTLPWLA